MATNQELHVIFGTGPVGRTLMKELVSKGKSVRIVNRSGRLDAPAGVEVVGADATDPAATRKLCQGAAVVYNCTNVVYMEWAEKMPLLQNGVLEGAASAGAKLVVMDNLYMYGDTHGQPIREDMPYAAATRKGRIRARMAEELFSAHSAGRVRVAIGRASDFFGPMVLEAAAGERMFVPALTGKTAQVMGNLDMPHTYSYVPDVARGLAVLGERDEALGQAWHLPGPQTVTTRQFYDLVCRETGKPARIQAAPRILIQALGLFSPIMRELVEMTYEFEEPFVLDTSRFEKTFGGQPTPLSEAVHQTVEWFRKR
jgi:nucleoside-diphosphate-sugar epimerase